MPDGSLSQQARLERTGLLSHKIEKTGQEMQDMRDITMCHPVLQELAARWMKQCEQVGIVVRIGECLRTVAEQDALYEQGRTKPGNIVTNAKGSSYSSQHQWGIAFDFYLQMDVDGDGKLSDDAYNDSTGMFGKAADIGKQLGLGWGGDWKSIVDKPHLYLPDWGSTTSKLKKLYGTPEAFMRTWEKTGWIQDGRGWWYRHADGSYSQNSWELIDGKWYWFDGAGYMVADAWKKTKDVWYYLGSDGSMVYNEIRKIGDEFFAFGKDGGLMTGDVALKTNDRGALIIG